MNGYKIMYNDSEYIWNYLEFGEYPKIHESIYSLHKKINAKRVADLCCGTGLLAHHLSQRYEHVVAIEADSKNLEKALPSPKIKYYCLNISQTTLFKLKKIFIDNNIDSVFIRRGVPELYDTGGIDLIRKLDNLFKECKIKYLVLEGRIVSKNSTHPLKSLDNEISLFHNYKETYRKKNCAVLELV
ncbi:MAG: hypothetical protein BZ138_07870 [Methanosphaera sp. rholeuAM270]|nr:MAG: hypothetical protein BZ138_07870 [Methanosphaera sp. rholeuAM270]